ncbi:MAG: YihY/virulence factor BrkB family protein [Ilumatobacteraceae bacterium]
MLASQGYARHLASRNAALLAYYGFLTLFPLIMVATTILGFFLQGDPELRTEIVESAISQIPVLGDQILNQSGQIGGSLTALVIGLASGLWGSTRAFAALQTALDDAWEVPVEHRPNLVVRRVRSVIGLLVIGGAQIATVTLTSIAGWADLGSLSRIAIGLGVLAVNIAVVTTMFRYLSATEVSWTMAWPGGVISGVAYTALQLIGTQVVSRLLSGAHSVYGAFASVLAITGWLLIHAVVSLFAAEINAAIHARRLVPVEESLDVRVGDHTQPG